MMKKSILSVVLLLAVSICLGQDLQKADQYFKRLDYYKAMNLYKEVLKKEKDAGKKQSLYFKVAECYRLTNHYEDAATWYQDALNMGFTHYKAYLGYAEVNQKMGKLDKALKLYEEYLQILPGDSAGVKGKRSVLKAKASAERLKQEKSSKSKFNKVYNQKDLNTPFSEYGVGWFGDKLMFSSSRKNEKAKKHEFRTGQGQADNFIAEYDFATGNWYNASKTSGGINTSFNDGTFAYDEYNNIGYIMQCNGKKTLNCNLNSTSYLNGTWTPAKILPFNSKDFSNGHPTLTPDGSVMYFVSDRPGGKGGRDIYMIHKSADGSWSVPSNLGDVINTPKDEMFPFIMGDSMLFFASEGHPGYGGLDIFMSVKRDGEWSNPVHLKYPFNTSSDDFNFLLNKDNTGGLFCSNRPGGVGMDDIYRFTNFPLFLKICGQVTDLYTAKPIPGAMVVFSDNKQVNDTLIADDQGYYEYTGLVPDTKFEVTVTAEDYFGDKKTYTVPANTFFKDFCADPDGHLDFQLIPKPIPVIAIKGKITERTTGEIMPYEKVTLVSNKGNDITIANKEGQYQYLYLPPDSYTLRCRKNGYWVEMKEADASMETEDAIYSLEFGHDMDFQLTKLTSSQEFVIDNIFYDYDKATLRPESMVELDKIYNMLVESPNIKIQLSSHTDERGSHSYNERLSQRRAQSCVDYLVSKGIPKRRLVPKGYGERKMLIKNAKTEEEHQLNRRTTFKVLKVYQAPKPLINPNDPVIFKLQLLITPQAVAKKEFFEKAYRNIPDIKIRQIKLKNGSYAYESGLFQEKELWEAEKLRRELQEMGYFETIIVPYQNGKRVDVNEAAKAIEMMQQ